MSSKNKENPRKFLITERSMNHLLRPVYLRKASFPCLYRVENLGEGVEIGINQSWTPSNHLVIDFISQEFYDRAYNQVRKNKTSWKNEISLKYLLQTRIFLRYAKIRDIIDDNQKQYLDKYKTLLVLERQIENYENQNEISLHGDKDESLNDLLQKRYELNEQLQCANIDLEMVKEIARFESQQGFTIKIQLSKLYKRYKTYFIQRRKEYFKKLLVQTSQVVFKIQYPLRVPIYTTVTKKGEQSQIIENVKLENVKIGRNRLFEVAIDGDTANITFNTFLGYVFLNNITTLNTDWLEERFLELHGYAAAIYRRFFVTRPGNKVDELELKTIVDHFDFMRNSGYPKIIERSFEEIKNAGLISAFEFKNTKGKFSKGWIAIKK